jgi:hypothetical protein
MEVVKIAGALVTCLSIGAAFFGGISRR